MTASQFFNLYYALWAANLCLTIGLIVFEIRQKNIAFVFWLSVLAVVVLPSFRDCFLDRAQVDVGLPTLDLVNNSLLIKAHAFCFLFGLIYLAARLALFSSERRLNAGWIVSDWARRAGADARARRFSLAAAFVCLAGVGMAGLAMTLGGVAVSALGYAGFMDNAALVPRLLAYYLVLTFSSAFALALWSRCWLAMACITAAAAAMFAVSNSRQFLVPACMIFVVAFAFRHGTAKRLVALLALAAVAYMGLYVLEALRFGRDTAGIMQVIEKGEVSQAVQQFSQSHGSHGESDLRLCEYYFFQDDVRQRLQVHGATYLRILMLPLPSTLAGSLKPPDPDNAFYQEYYKGLGWEGTLPILMFGNAYQNLGWMGLILAVFWAGVAYAAKWMMARVDFAAGAVLAGFYATACIHTARGAIYDTTALVFWGSVAIGACAVGLWLWDRPALGAAPGLAHHVPWPRPEGHPQ